jgi:hypothetical protein
MNSPRVTYGPRPGATPEDEVLALAAVYRLVLQAHEKKKGASPDALDDVKEDQHVHTATRSLQS